MDKTESVGTLIRCRRLALGLRSQHRLAELVGVDRSHIAKIENGTIALPQPALRRRLGEVLGLSERDFLTAAGFLTEEPVAYDAADDPEEQQLRVAFRGLSNADRSLLLDFAHLLEQRRRSAGAPRATST